MHVHSITNIKTSSHTYSYYSIVLVDNHEVQNRKQQMAVTAHGMAFDAVPCTADEFNNYWSVTAQTNAGTDNTSPKNTIICHTGSKQIAGARSWIRHRRHQSDQGMHHMHVANSNDTNCAAVVICKFPCSFTCSALDTCLLSVREDSELFHRELNTLLDHFEHLIRQLISETPNKKQLTNPFCFGRANGNQIILSTRL